MQRQIDAEIDSERCVPEAFRHQLAIGGLREHLQSLRGYGADMGRIVKEIVVAGMRDDDGDGRAIAADAVNLLDDPEIDVGDLTQVLQHMGQKHLVHRVVRPRQPLEVHDLVRAAVRYLVDVAPAGPLTVAASEIEPHAVSTDAVAARRARGGRTTEHWLGQGHSGKAN